MATTLTVEESKWRITLSGELGSDPLPLSYIENLIKYENAIQALSGIRPAGTAANGIDTGAGRGVCLLAEFRDCHEQGDSGRMGDRGINVEAESFPGDISAAIGSGVDEKAVGRAACHKSACVFRSSEAQGTEDRYWGGRDR